MSDSLDVHPADETEKRAAFRNVHDVWGRGLSVEQHVQRRLASVQHNRAQWFVGCCGGEVAASLGVYPQRFRCRGAVVPGIAIGAVHTRAEFRRRGFARELVLEVERLVHAATGAAISLLYSDIKPGYYARLGYVQCPARAADFDPRDEALDGAAAQAVELTLTRHSPAEALPVMADLYAAAHADLPLSIHRDDDYWRFLSRKSPHDDVYLCGPSGSPFGYLRLAIEGTTMTLRDVVAKPGSLAGLLNATVALARQRGLQRVWGWLPQLPPEFAPFTIRQRPDEITMLKSLSDAVPIDAAITAAADWFHELDHV